MKANSFVVAISGGPDSLALAALTKAYSFEKKLKFYYVLIDHNIRKNSSNEANQVKKLLLQFDESPEGLSFLNDGYQYKFTGQMEDQQKELSFLSRPRFGNIILYLM